LVFADKEITEKDIPERIRENKNVYSMKWEDIERNHIDHVLRIMKGNQRQTAISIGYSINTLKSKMVKYGINVADE
jgi:DNA-binding protein Fis